MIAELDPAVMEPAVVLYLRIALPDWPVSWKGHKAIATHPDGSRAVWMYKYNGGDHAWISSLPDALLIAHPELGGYLLIRQSTYEPTHTREVSDDRAQVAALGGVSSWPAWLDAVWDRCPTCGGPASMRPDDDGDLWSDCGSEAVPCGSRWWPGSRSPTVAEMLSCEAVGRVVLTRLGHPLGRSE